MSLITQPIQDITLEGWGPSPLWSRISEYHADDSTYIQGPSSGTFTCEVKCYAIDDPQCDWGHHVYYRYCRKGTGTGTVNLGVKLMCGSTEIASWVHSAIGSAVVEAEQTLTAAQADAIADYGNLRLRFTHTSVSGSGYSAAVTWALIETPEVGEVGAVSVSPTARAAVAGRYGPAVVLGSLQISPVPAQAAAGCRLASIASPSDLLVAPDAPVSARTDTAFQLYIAPAPAAARADGTDPTLIMSSFACAPASPSSAVAAIAAPVYIVTNAVVVELDLRGRTTAGVGPQGQASLTLGERPGVYLEERWALEDGTGHWRFADETAIILGIGLSGTKFNLWPRGLGLSIELLRES